MGFWKERRTVCGCGGVKLVTEDEIFDSLSDSPEQIADDRDDNLDVCVRTENGDYTFVVATIDNLKHSFWLDERGFVNPISPPLLVERLTKEAIESLIDEVMKDEKLAELYGGDRDRSYDFKSERKRS